MKYLVIRHAQTDGNRLNRALFGKLGAPLNEQGTQQAKLLGDALRARGIELDQVTVAVSELQRTAETAVTAGISKDNLVVNTLLNEVDTPDAEKTQALLDTGTLPPEAIASAKALLANPPAETIWVAHGVLIAALREVLGLPGFIPDTCEVVELEL